MRKHVKVQTERQYRGANSNSNNTHDNHRVHKASTMMQMGDSSRGMHKVLI